jgi:transposase
MDTKAVVKVGPFARGGKNRVLTKAVDHDFEAEAAVTPVGIFLPALNELFLYGVTSKVTSDCLVDRLIQWWESVKERFGQIKTLVINVDNGPENQSHRTQFMQRLLEFTQNYQMSIRLAYYPPYHSKYNPVERCWGILEHHWNGALLDSVDAVIHFAETMTWKGNHPVVELVTTAYQAGVKLAKEAMKAVETHLQRWPSLEKWFVDISSQPVEKQEHSTQEKRQRGRPRTRPLPDPTQPKRPRGRPRKPVLAKSITSIATPD